MKLMFVGVANIGKTTLLNQLRQEGTGSYQNSPPVGWTERKVKKRRAGSITGTWTTVVFAAKLAFSRRTYHPCSFSLREQKHFRQSYHVSLKFCTLCVNRNRGLRHSAADRISDSSFVPIHVPCHNNALSFYLNKKTWPYAANKLCSFWEWSC